jgi:hypothetical protein
MPLSELCAFVGSPSQVRIRNVPRGVGNWKLTTVYLAVNYPDNTVQAPSCVLTGGIWTATIPGSTATGMSGNGFQVLADGVDEHGDVVTGYVLGAGDVRILPRDGTITVGETAYYYHFLDAVPISPKKCDTCIIGGVLKWYDGTAWQTFADGGASIDVVPPSTDPSASGKAADAKATGDALAGKRGLADMAVYAETTTWAWTGEDATAVAAMTAARTYAEWDDSLGWVLYDLPEDYHQTDYPLDGDATTIVFEVDTSISLASITGTRSSSVAPVTGDALAKTSQLSAKQDAISDLAAIRSGAAAGATAVQPSALAGAVRYDLGAMIGINGDSITTDTSVTPNVDYVSVTLADRTLNRLVINVAFDELRLTFPAKVAGKVRDFGVRVEIDNSSGGTDMADIALAAPTPTSTETLYIETADGAMPKIKGAAAGASATMILYFTETAEGVFMVKGEEVKEVS